MSAPGQSFFERVFTASPQMLMSPAEFVRYIASLPHPTTRDSLIQLDDLVEVARLIAAVNPKE